MVLPVTLSAAAAAALINIWLSLRTGRVRRAHGISVGDGGNETLQRRMRAQLNFAENVPLVLVLLAAVELSGRGGLGLHLVAAAFLLARVLHALGMDGGALQWGRMIGAIATILTQLGLALVALVVAVRAIA